MSMSYQHTNLAEGRWHRFSLAEQLGHVGSEVSRAFRWEGTAQQPFSATGWGCWLFFL